MKKLLLSVTFILLVNMLFAQFTVGYISMWSGAKLFSMRSSKSEVLSELKFGDKVYVWDFNDPEINVMVKLEKDKVEESIWRLVEIRTGEETISGYIPEAFLHIGERTIPPHTLYYYYNLSVFNDTVSGFGIYYDENTSRFKRQHTQQGPYDYNQPNESYANMLMTDKNDDEHAFNTETGMIQTDTIRHYLGLELVHDDAPYLVNKKQSRYPVDTTHIERVLNAEPLAFTFSLPVNNGKDSIVMGTNPNPYSDAVISYSYAGQIPKLNKYIICAIYEEPSHILYDKTTGQRQGFTEGFPYISPDGKYVVDFYETMGFEDDPSCSLRISRLDKHMKVIPYIYVNFKSWLPDYTYNSAFWISDRELIIRAFTVKNHLYSEVGLNPIYEYIKLTIR